MVQIQFSLEDWREDGRWDGGFEETDWVTGLMSFSKANPQYMSLVSMTQEKKVLKHLDPCKNNFTNKL